MADVFRRLIDVAFTLGTVTEALMYENGYITVEGKTADGEPFKLSLRKEKQDEGTRNC